MQLRDVMTRDVEIVRPDATLAEAAGRMKALDVGPLPVCDGNRLVGMLTDRDVTTRATAAGQDPRTTRVRDAMTPDVAYCFEDQDISEAEQLMRERKIRRIAVLDRNKQLVGMVSLGDLATKSGGEKAPHEVLTDVSEPAHPKR